MEVIEVLEGMLDVLHDKDWIQGQLYAGPEGDDPTGVCLEGACNIVLWSALRRSAIRDGARFGQLRKDAGELVIEAAREVFGEEKVPGWVSIMFQFNDLETTTREDVILAVKTAIERAHG
jgi:hypothetical protein